jgi:hypothetical protein
MLAGLECGEDPRVHVDGKILLCHDLLVSCLDGLVNPVTEGLTHDGVDYVSQVGQGQLLYLPGLHPKRQCNGGLVLCVMEHCINGQSLEVRNRNVLNSGALDGSPIT